VSNISESLSEGEGDLYFSLKMYNENKLKNFVPLSFGEGF
jgi:hypothetical protein